MKFKNKRYITKGVSSDVSLLLQLFMWECIDRLNVPRDYLQVFKCSAFDGMQKLIHIQEEPEYSKEYLFFTDAPFFIGKVYVIDNGFYSVMMLSEEY